MLQPIAAPSILGLFGFAGATFIVAAHLAGWYGSEKSPEFLFPFAAMFGGLAQFLAGMWAFKARDAVATAMHGMWVSFWLAYRSTLGLALLVALFFAGCFVAYEPYRAPYPDLIPDEQAGRSQSTPAAWWVASGAILLSIAPLRRLRSDRIDRRELASAS